MSDYFYPLSWVAMRYATQTGDAGLVIGLFFDSIYLSNEENQ